MFGLNRDVQVIFFFSAALVFAGLCVLSLVNMAMYSTFRFYETLEVS